MGRVVHFEIHATDPGRSREFYEQVFGWSFQQWGEQPYWVVRTGDESTPGIDGGLAPRRGDPPEVGAPVNAFVATVAVKETMHASWRRAAAGALIPLAAVLLILLLLTSPEEAFGYLLNPPGS